jgi:hypothetical protein
MSVAADASSSQVRRVEASEASFAAALEAARDFRGDVTLLLTDGTALEGFVFDTEAMQGRIARVRMLPSDGGPRRTVDAMQIRSVAFTGRDAAAGKTWENWVRRYAEKRRKGEAASIESESLD